MIFGGWEVERDWEKERQGIARLWGCVCTCAWVWMQGRGRDRVRYVMHY